MSLPDFLLRPSLYRALRALSAIALSNTYAWQPRQAQIAHAGGGLAEQLGLFHRYNLRTNKKEQSS